MTDNEKAATFIGWQQGLRATSWAECPTHCPCGEPVGRLPAMDGGMIHQPHDIPAPDMADPRNYMRALEQGVVGEDMWLQLEGSQLATNNYKPEWKSRVGSGEWRIGATVAESIIKTLAALYDLRLRP